MIDLSHVDVEDLLQRLDVSNARLTSSGTEVNFSCFGPEHSHGDESPSAYINVETTAWFCHGCKRRGNALNLIIEIHNVTRPTAERSLRDWYGIEFNEPVGGSMMAETEARFRPVEPPPELIKPPASWLLGARIDWYSAYDHDDPEGYEGYMINRGFRPEALEDWDIGYDYASDRISIPVFDVDGTLVGIKGRDWTGERQPKYLILGDRPGRVSYGFSPYEASQVLFGLHRNRDCKSVVLCEGELNAIALAQLGIPRPIATGMSYFGDRHAQLLCREAEELVVFYDYGEAGRQGVWGRWDAAGKFRPGIVQVAQQHMPVRVVQALQDDPADLLEQGRGDVALELVEHAPSALALSSVFG